MTKAEMQWVIQELIDRETAITFDDAMQAVGNPSKGEMVLECGKNAILWYGMSREFAEAVSELRADGLIGFRPMSNFETLISGSALIMNLPIGHRPLPRGYKTPHWVPVAIERPRPIRRRKAKTSVRVN